MVLFLLLFSLQAKETKNFTAHVYDSEPKEGKNEGPFLYEIKSETTIEGETEKTRIVTSEAGGKFYSEQQVRYEKGQPVEYTAHIPSLEFQTRVRIENAQVLFSSTFQGKHREEQDSLPENFMIGPTLNRYIRNHFSELANHQDLKVQIGIPMRGMTVGFKLFRVESDEKEVKEGKWLKIRMKPTNIVFNAMMPAAFYYLDAQSGNLIMYVGPTEYRRPGSKEGFIGTVRYIP